MSLSQPFWRRRWSFLGVFEKPILFRIIIQWVDHLGHQLVLFRDLEDSTRIFMPPTVISCGEYREKLAAGKPFKAVHDTFVGAKNKFAHISVEEKLDTVRPELYYVSSVIRISDLIRLYPHFLIVVSRV